MKYTTVTASSLEELAEKLNKINNAHIHFVERFAKPHNCDPSEYQFYGTGVQAIISFSEVLNA